MLLGGGGTCSHTQCCAGPGASGTPSPATASSSTGDVGALPGAEDTRPTLKCLACACWCACGARV
eukprot:15439291-Alexandrium_andersonii.AAC.1